MDNEIQALRERKVCILVPKPDKTIIVNNWWVYTVKINEDDFFFQSWLCDDDIAHLWHRQTDLE